MNNEKHGVTWHLPKTLHIELSKLADKQKRSVQNLATLLIERGIESEKKAKESEDIRMTIQIENAIQVINDCLTVNALDSAFSYVKLFNLAYGSNDKIEAAYQAKKELLIN